MHPPVAVQGLTKRYAGRTVVDEVTFSVEAGSVLCVLGRNGAGKTTTIECVEGFRRPDAGTVRVFGVDPVAQRDAVVSRMGVMLQEGGAYQAATPVEMLRLYAQLYQHPRTVDEVLALVDLQARAGSRIRTLSGGEKQRLNLALALIGRPDLYFLDEPTAGMDPAARRRTWALVESLRDEGAAVVLTTHLIEEAERLADHVAIMADGRILTLDTPAGITGAGHGLLVTTPAAVEAETLTRGLGRTATHRSAGQFLVDGGAEDIAHVTAWFAAQGLALDGVTAARPSLEDTFLALTGQPADAT